MKFAEKLIDILIGLVVFGALFPVINTSITAMGLDTINVSGTVRDFSWAGYLIVLLLILGAVYLVMNSYKKTG